MMFTGIIEELGRVRSITHGRNSVKLLIECQTVMADLKIGDSVAVDGICLTVTAYGRNGFTVDGMPETVRKSALNSLTPNQIVNLERALKISERLGGHIVSGHIDGVGIIGEKAVEDNAVWLTLNAPATILKYIVPQGSVALNGVSLTVASMNKNCLQVSLIPFTHQNTNLNLKKEGDIVNIECDVIGKYVHMLITGIQPEETDKSGLSIEFLKENGFV
jgi:riboflavin synthase